MEQAHRFRHAIGPTEFRAVGKRGVEWDLNDWGWDGDLFIATPRDAHSIPSDFRGQQFIPVTGNSSNSSSSCSDDVHSGVVDNGRRETERKRRVIVVEENSLDEAGSSLALKLGGGGEGYPGTSGKKTKLAGGSSSRAACQVEDCGADLSKAKDYHRRHKVCEMHSKATKALVGNVMQRFCQQCSRFHLLQEFDEGKRSCRRRLAGHNKRRRKTQPDSTVQGSLMNDDQTNSVLLISLLRILSNMHANSRPDPNADQDLVAQLLRSLANPSGMHAGKDITGLLHESQKLLNGGMPNGHSEKISSLMSNDHQNPSRVFDQHLPLSDSEIPRRGVHGAESRGGELQATASQKPGIMFPIKDSPPTYSESTAGRMKSNNFDLNDVYVDSDDGTEDLERSPVNGNFATCSPDFRSWARQDSHQSSPPQTSTGNSDSASAQSPSSSSGEAQSRTDRIVFKLFGKEPSEFPMVLRGQILDWLAHSPTEIESYIRPGCIILTIYLRLADSSWEELCTDLSSSLTRLFDISYDAFWNTGWVYARVQNHVEFCYNGQSVLNKSLPLPNTDCSRIVSVTPVAVSIAEKACFQVRVSNLSRSTTRLLCALEGKYLDQETSPESEEDGDSESDDEIEHVNLSCSIPDVVGRGFIEVEDDGLSSSFFPFIVADKEVCSEIRTLESVLECKDTHDNAYEVNGESEARRQAIDFINELGWLLHRSHLRSRLGHLDPSTVIFSFRRFKWLVDFSMDHDWCAVVKRLLDVLVSGNIVGTAENSSLTVALSELGLLHRAVRRNSRLMVEQLLRYVPAPNEFESSTDEMSGQGKGFLFRPDVEGPGGLTPLHVAAGRDGAEDVLDALTDDPRKIGIEAWKNAQDSTGATPEDYARLRGHYSYIHLVQRKINSSRRFPSGHVVLDIPGEPSAASFEIARSELSLAFTKQKSCKLCSDHKMGYYYGATRASLVYRPAMLSMVAIAAVCVCVALLFKSMPSVVCLFRPFRWELLDFGSS